MQTMSRNDPNFTPKGWRKFVSLESGHLRFYFAAPAGLTPSLVDLRELSSFLTSPFSQDLAVGSPPTVNACKASAFSPPVDVGQGFNFKYNFEA